MKETDVLNQQGGLDKIKRYDWVIRDVPPGKLEWIPKNQLEVDRSYQRERNNPMTTSISSKWSWIACGVLTVARRPNGIYYVIDGQHRLMAALNRSDITNLPCIVFELDSIITEAQGFIDSDTFRRNILSLDKFKAQKKANDETALFIQGVFDRHGIKPSTSKAAKNIKSISACYNLAQINKRQFEIVIALVSELCINEQISEKLLLGIDYLSKHLEVSILDRKLRNRILSCGVSNLERGATEDAAYYSKGGARIFAMGMLKVINKGLRNKYKFKDEVVE